MPKWSEQFLCFTDLPVFGNFVEGLLAVLERKLIHFLYSFFHMRWPATALLVMNVQK